MNKDEILFNSKGNFIKIKSFHKGNYFYAERKGIDSVAFIYLDRKNKTIGLVNERKPPLDDRFNKTIFLTTAFGGSIDTFAEEYERINIDENIIFPEQIEICKKIVQQESLEEAGYNISLDKIYFVSRDLVSTQMNQFCYLFFIDVTDIEKGEPQPENEMEKLAELIWIPFNNIKLTNCMKAKSIFIYIKEFIEEKERLENEEIS